MNQPLIEVKIRAPTGKVSILQVTEIVSIDGEPYNHQQTEDLQGIYQAIRHLEGRIEGAEVQISSLLSALLQPHLNQPPPHATSTETETKIN